MIPLIVCGVAVLCGAAVIFGAAVLSLGIYLGRWWSAPPSVPPRAWNPDNDGGVQ